ncbi:F0F1 ATP synthase subunit A [Rubrivirga sp.]|uniref:F0F1 ATP synthase subunit A n=1 Tax=Rubrivirga sp. TaxID=1885344 RepID=UPI003C76B4E7
MSIVSRFILVLALAVVAVPAHAADGVKLDAVGHTADGNYLDFEPAGKIQLPRLFVVRGESGLRLDAYWTSKAAVASGDYQVAGASVTADLEDGDLVAPAPEAVEALPVYKSNLVPAEGEVVIDLSITRHLVWALLAIAIVLGLFLPFAAKYKRGIGRSTAPRGTFQNLMETFVVYVRDEIARPNIGDKYERYLPYLLASFFFILVANLIGLVPFGATATGNIMTTVVLALFTFVITQFAGTKDYWMHVLWPPGVPWFVKPILVPIEILGLFTKPFALAVRLFANMAAGHLVILNLIGLIFLIGAINTTAGWLTTVPAVLLTAGVYILKVLVAFIQAYVFTLLSALFIGMATAEHEHDHDHSEDHGLTAHDVAVSQSNGQADHKLHERTVGSEAALSPA